MTNDSDGLRRIAPSAVVAGLLVVAMAGNAAAILGQAAQSGHPAVLSTVIIDEVSSGLIWLMLAAVIVRIFRWAMPSRLSLPVIPLVHAVAIPAVSLTHFVLTRALRVIIYATQGENYAFLFTWPDFVSDLYKDILSYLLLGLIYLGTERLLAAPAKSSGAPRPELKTTPVIDVRDGANTQFVPASDILWAEAAGNYVELHIASGRTLLMRTTLAGLARRLDGAGFLRVHRSRLVNPDAIAALENLPAGDAILHLATGAEISVSRTYRAEVSRRLLVRTDSPDSLA